jgi:three-Cys-motif partner protein
MAARSELTNTEQMAQSIVGPWAKDKLERLGKYLNAYTTIMRKQVWCGGFAYIDALAGPGRHELRKKKGTRAAQSLLLQLANPIHEDPGETEYINGSPHVALDLRFPFSWYVFIETDPARIANLQKLKAEYGETRNIVIRQSDCNEYLLGKLVNNAT